MCDCREYKGVLVKGSGVASFAAALTRLAEGKAEISAQED